VNCELIQETSYLHPVSSQESVRDKTQIHSRSLADIADHTLRERMPVPNISRKTMPLLPDVGVMALVPDEWSAPWQTRHHVLSRLARYFQVVWVDPAQEWREVLKQRQERTRKSSALGEASGLEVYTPEFWLPKFYRPAFLAQLSSRWRLRRAHRSLMRRGCQKIVLYLWRPEFADALLSVAHNRGCYHIDDEYSFSDVDMPLDKSEAELIAKVDQVFVHSRQLYAKKGSINPNTIYVPNGVAYDAYAKEAPQPHDLASVPHPRVGYTGYLKRTLDWDLCFHLARKHPEWSLVFVGPVAPSPEVLEAVKTLSGYPRVYFLGSKSVQQLAAYPQHFDVCIMPYRTDTHSMKYGYPLKLHEYLASGRPSVASPLFSLQEFADVVTLASTPEEWSAAITKALCPDANTQESRAARQAVARQYDWDLLVSRIARALVRTLGQEFADRLAHLTGEQDA